MDIVAVLLLSPVVAASYQDLRTREVDDKWWFVMLGIGTVSACFQGTGALMWTLGSVLICLSAMTEGKKQVLALFSGCVTWVICAFVIGFSDNLLSYALEPVFILVYFIFYVAGIIRGGADVKCLMSLTVAVPVNSIYSGYLALAFPPSMCILFLSAIMLLIIGGLGIILKGGLRTFPNYRMPADWVDETFVTVAEDTGGLGSREYCEKAAAEGRSVLVSPLFPFIAYLTAGFAVWHILEITI